MRSDISFVSTLHAHINYEQSQIRLQAFYLHTEVVHLHDDDADSEFIKFHAEILSLKDV